MACSNDQEIQAVIFDLDGVVTCTMRAHFAAWREVFDHFLRTHTQSEKTFVPFSLHDYFTHVDGVPRLEGIRRFLISRDIELPEGAPNDTGTKTIHGLANLKNERYLAWLDANEVPTYSDARDLIGSLKRRGKKIGIFSSSRNCDRALRSAGIVDLFDAKVDGVDAARLALPPKPNPALLLETVGQLGIQPAKAIVVEDAVSGVEAAVAGGFRYVIGIDREPSNENSHALALRAAGANFVTRDLTDVLDLCLLDSDDRRR
ncbi:MAG: HAD-IA family hydrolase [Methyloceanibacter sp.]|nr:HAD-IA family hydrolase [Methyloceanibacter sp.]